MMPGDHVLEPLRLLERERVLGAATRTGQVDVLRLGPAVILGARLEVRVREDPDIFERRQRAVHGRRIDARDSFPDPPGHSRRADVAVRRHDLGHDGPSLRRHPKSEGAKELDGILATGGSGLGGHARHCSTCMTMQQHHGGRARGRKTGYLARMTVTPFRTRGTRLPGQGAQHDPPLQVSGLKLQGAHFDPGPVNGMQSWSFWQIPTSLHSPRSEQKHVSGIPTQAQLDMQGEPNWQGGQVPPAQAPPDACAKAGVAMLVRIGADHATAAPAPILFRIVRREMRSDTCSSMAIPPGPLASDRRPIGPGHLRQFPYLSYGRIHCRQRGLQGQAAGVGSMSGPYRIRTCDAQIKSLPL